jgi:N-acetylglucosamine kinase-like BadF-type ATPase
MILAVDQGSSKTVVVLINKDGQILAHGKAGGACYFTSSVPKAFAEIEAAASSALGDAGSAYKDIKRIYAGLAGANWPDEIDMLTREMKSRFKVDAVTVCNDCVIALRGGSNKENSIVVCAGSALNAAIMINGEVRQVMNNYIDSTDQGGIALANRTLQAVFESQTGIRKPTILTDRLLDYFGYDKIDDLLIGRDHKKLKSPLYNVVEILLRTADENDGVALDVIYEFSESVSRYITSSIRKYDLIGKDCDIVLSGGVFKSYNPLFCETISVAVHRVSRQANIVNAKYEPIIGAALLGLEAENASETAVRTCENDAQKLGLVRGFDKFSVRTE